MVMMYIIYYTVYNVEYVYIPRKTCYGLNCKSKWKHKQYGLNILVVLHCLVIIHNLEH